MKIALVHKRLDLNGGTERDLFQTAEGLRQLGHEVHLFCSEYGVVPPQDVVAHRVPVVPLGRTARLWSFDWFGQAAVNKESCDVVIGFGRLQRQDILRCGGGTHRGFLHRLGTHAGWRRRFWQIVSIYHQSVLTMEKRQYDSLGARTIVAVSGQVKRDIIANYGVPAEKIVVLYNGVDRDRFHPSRRGEVRDQVRKRWRIPFDAPLILFVGSGFRRKGLEHLLAIWKSPKLDRVFLLVVGADARIEQYKSMADAIAPGRIIFTGRQEDVENYYAASDGVALPSLQEAFGNVVVEALASGLPVVVSRDAGASEILHGSLAEGIFDRSDDPEILERKLLWLLEKSRDPGSVAQAREIAEEHSWQNHFRKLEACLLENRRTSPGAPVEFNLKRRGSAKIWIADSIADPLFVSTLAEADRLFAAAGCQVIKDQKKIKVARLTLMLAGTQRTLYIKRYNPFSLRFRLLSLFLPSGARRSLHGAEVLRRAQIARAEPIAAVESLCYGMVRHSFFVSEEVAGGKTADAYWIENLQRRDDRSVFKQRRGFLRGLALLFHALHARQIYHNDLKDANILVVNTGHNESIQCFLLDLEGVRQCVRLSARRRIKNLVQLYRTLGRHVSRSHQTFFLKCYLGRAFEDGKVKRKLIERLLGSARNVELAKARRWRQSGGD